MGPPDRTKDRWGRLRVYTLAATAVSVTAGAIIGVMNAAGILEPYWVSTRGFTRTVVAQSESKTGHRLLAIEIATKELARDNTQSQIDRLEIELKKNDNAADSIKQILNEQLSRYRSQLRAIERDIEALQSKGRE